MLTGVVAPYRLPLFAKIAQRIPLWVLISGNETESASGLSELDAPRLVIRRASGFKFASRKARAGVVRESRSVHVNPGYAAVLFRLRPDAVISGEMGFRTVSALLYGLLFKRPVWVS